MRSPTNRRPVYRTSNFYPLNRDSTQKSSTSQNAIFAILYSGSTKAFVWTPAVNFAHDGGDYQTYAVAADGKRFLMLQFVNPSLTGNDALGPDATAGLIVARDWASSIKR